MRRVLIFLLFVSLLLSPISDSTHAQPEPPKLPADLLVSNFGNFDKIDAETLEGTPFYIDNTVSATYMRSISWSPNGQYLAFLKPGTWEVCIVTRAGVLHQCFEDKVSRWDTFGTKGDHYTITWSEDEETIYFLADYGNLRSLVEASIIMGLTQHTIYQYDTHGELPPKVYWTPTLDYVSIYSPEFVQARYHDPIQMGSITLVHPPDNETFTMPAELPELGSLSFCHQFSPLGSYIVARAYTDEEHPSFAIFDSQGNVLYTISNSRFQAMGLTWVDCPSWWPDEQAFYFLASNPLQSRSEDKTYILKYSLLEDTLIQYAQVLPSADTPEGRPISPLVVSPDGNYLAFEVADILLEPGKFVNELAVAFPSSEVIRLGERFQFNLYPIWIPPLQD